VGDALYRYATQPEQVDTVPFGAYRRSLFEHIGGYDETLESNEDYEFNTRIRLNGGGVWLNPEIRSVYFARSTLGALSKQYFRYGYWKWRMLRRYPKTLRWRQGLPPIFTLSLLGLIIFALFWAPARVLLAFEIVLYFSILMAASARLAVQKHNPVFVIGVPISIAVMHLSWGAGFLGSLVKSLLESSPTPGKS